ncbi:MAG: ORF6N domain-containing protein [Bacteroidales bacterium]|nr:ORF6N domain-containing protein [Bacteroidales bacterium]
MSKLPILKEANLASLIYFIRGEKVMLDTDLAKLYDVETRVLKQAVRRNLDRFPKDFMFELTDEEIDRMVSQGVIPSKQIFGGAKPFAFTEQGIAMLSSVLNSRIAIQVNIAILRTFVKLRQLLIDHKDLAEKIERMEQKYDEQFRIIFTALQQMLQEESTPRPKIGFKQKEI